MASRNALSAAEAAVAEGTGASDEERFTTAAAVSRLQAESVLKAMGVTDASSFDGLANALTVDGVDPGVSTDTLESAYFDRDQAVFCTVTPNDGSEDGEAVDSNTVTISNTAPTIDSLSLAPDPARAADTLSCSYTGYADADDDASDSDPVAKATSDIQVRAFSASVVART